MTSYFLSIQHLGLFLLALLISVLFKRQPRLCYAVWIVFLLKLLLPMGPLEISLPLLLSDVSQEAFILKKILPNGVEAILNGRLPLHLDQFAHDIQNFFLNGALSLFGIHALSLREIFIVEWIFLSVSLLIVQIYSYYRLRQQLLTWKIVDNGPLYDLYRDCCQKVGLHFTPVLRLAPIDNLSPFAIGLTRRSAVIVVPQGYIETEKESFLRTVLCHELSHVKNGDVYISLLQFAGLLIFHIHPLRILADRFINFYKEICCDMHAIRSLGIPKKEYTAIIARFYLQEHSLKYGLASALVSPRQPFIKRLLYVRSTPLVNLHSRLYSHRIGAALVLFFFFTTLILPESNPNHMSVTLPAINSIAALPQPAFSSPNPIDGVWSTALVSDSQIWIQESRSGVFGFHLTPRSELEAIASYRISTPTDTDVETYIQSVNFYRNYLYLLLREHRARKPQRSYLQIIRQEDSNTLSPVGKLQFETIVSTAVCRNHLWLVHNQNNYSENTLSIFDLSNPEVPVPSQSRSLDLLTTFIKPSPHSSEVFLSKLNSLIVMRDSDFSSPLQELPLDTQPIDIAFLDEKRIVVLGFQNKYLSLDKIYKFFLLEKSWSSYYQIQSTLEIIEPYKEANTSRHSLLTLQDQILFCTPKIGIVLFKAEKDRLSLHTYIPEKRYDCIVLGDRLAFFQPNYMVFAIADFIRSTLPGSSPTPSPAG